MTPLWNRSCGGHTKPSSTRLTLRLNSAAWRGFKRFVFEDLGLLRYPSAAKGAVASQRPQQSARQHIDPVRPPTKLLPVFLIGVVSSDGLFYPLVQWLRRDCFRFQVPAMACEADTAATAATVAYQRLKGRTRERHVRDHKEVGALQKGYWDGMPLDLAPSRIATDAKSS